MVGCGVGTALRRKSMTFAQKLRELIDAAGLTVDDLSKRANLPYVTVRAYLSQGKAHRKPTLGNAVKLAKALRVSLDLFGDCSDWTEESD